MSHTHLIENRDGVTIQNENGTEFTERRGSGILTPETIAQKKRIARKVIKFKNEFNLSNIACAKILNVDHNSISNWENGRCLPKMTRNGCDNMTLISNAIDEFKNKTSKKPFAFPSEPVAQNDGKNLLKKAEAIAKVFALEVDDATKIDLLKVLF